MGVPTRALQNFFVFWKQRCNNQKFQISNPNPFQFTHHQTLKPFKPNTPYLPHSLSNIAFFVALEMLDGELQCSLSFRIIGTMCEYVISFNIF
jgi:hypothetical protein